jgi:hypothetical protein
MSRVKKIELVTIVIDGKDVIAKMCTGCMKTKALYEFSNSSDGSAGGKQPKCKQCRSERFKQTYKPSENITRITTMEIDGEVVEAKVCTLCKVLKPMSDYHNAKSGGTGGKNSGCKECVNANSRKYKDDNREKMREYSRIKWANNKEEESLKKKKYYNSEKSSVRFKDWYYKNTGKIKVKNMNWIAKNKKLKASLTIDELNEIVRTFDNKCALTGNANFEFDHFIAVRTGNSGTVKENIIPLCKFLNNSKKSRNPFEWVKWPHIQEMIIPGSFERLIEYLAKENSMTVDQYRDHVYKCYENL